MKKLVENFPAQLTAAIEIGKKAVFTPAANKLTNVLISGLGGSGIGGSIASEIFAGESRLPINVTKGYFIPAYVNESTLVIVSSYSGNTEETLNCLELALERKAKIVCVTSGGKVAALAKSNGLDLVLIPGEMPPRACLGYSLTQLLFVLSYFDIISNQFIQQLTNAAELLVTEKENTIKLATELANKLHGKLPVIYTTTYFEGVAIRFRQQLNENAKMLCWHQIIPEMNHNELVGWREKNENLSVIVFRDVDEYSRNNSRIEINKEVITTYTSNWTDVYSKGKSLLEKAIYFIHLGDWISVLLAEKRGFDATEINVINNLKSALSKI